MLEEHEAQHTLRGVNPRKAAGPDGILGCVLKTCADQLAVAFTRIFNQSLTQYTVPPCQKSSVSVPLPKKTAVSSLNDYRPVVLTLIIMKYFETLFGGTSSQVCRLHWTLTSLLTGLTDLQI